jgi:lactate permease
MQAALAATPIALILVLMLAWRWSAAAAGVLFTSLQARTAEALALPAATLVAAQGVGAAVGNVVCPHHVVAGAATVGLAGREAEILRRTLLPCALHLAAAGLLVAAWTRWAP